MTLLKAHRIEILAPIRAVKKSRHNPQFNRGSLASELPRAGIQTNLRTAFQCWKVLLCNVSAGIGRHEVR